VQIEAGHLERATAYASGAVDAARAQLELAPADPKAKLSLGRAMFTLAHVEMRTVKTAVTPEFLDQMIAVLEEAARDGADADEASKLLGWAYFDRGFYDEDLGERARFFERSEEIRAGLAQRHPDNVSYRADLAWSRLTWGDTLLDLGRVAEGTEIIRAGVAIREDLVKLEPSNQVWQRDLGTADVKLCRAMARGGDAAAQTTCDATRSLLETLVAKNPADLDARHALSDCYQLIGDIQAKLSRTRRVRDAYEKACGLLEAIAAADPLDRVRRLEHVSCVTKEADAELLAGGVEDARADAQRAVTLAQPVADSAPADEGAQHRLAAARAAFARAQAAAPPVPGPHQLEKE
jgi:tetratricopeptide (TPR) repeat protein